MRHAWLLHAWLIFSLLFLPAARLARADGGDGFTKTSSESSVSVNVWASEGTSGMSAGDSRQVIANAQLNTWEVWNNSETGAFEIRNSYTVSLAGTGMTFSASGDGSVSPPGTSTDTNGNAVATFTMGSNGSTVTATVTDYGATGSVTFDTPIIPETWTGDHEESLLMASLSADDSTDSVTNGATRQAQAHVVLSTWTVYFSNFGNTKNDNYSTSPAISAQIAWSASGDGALDSSSSSTDSSGNATVTFTMGAAASLVQANVSYATTNSTYATLAFSPASVEETWTLDHVVSSISGITVGANGSTDALAPGTQRTVTAAVTSDSYEVWISNLGNTEDRNPTSGPASGTSVSFSLDSGDGALSGSSATTGSDGNASVGFTMGSATSQVTASAGGYSASISFYPGTESWTYHHSESALSFSNFTADGSTNDLRPGNTRTLTSEVTKDTWDVWMSNYGNTENRNPATNPASSVNVGFSVQSGNGQISSGSSTTDSSGHATTGFTMGTQACTVQADMNDGGSGNGTVTASLTFTLGEPTWNHDHTETTISTTLTSDGSTDMVPSGATRVVTANVSFDTWEVWMDDAGNTENRNYSYGGANNASIYFSVTEGDGTLTNAAYSTDSNGYATATFTMGTKASTVQADANYASASSSGTIKFTPDPWTYVESKSALSMSLAADDTTSIATATVTLTTWDVYSNGSTTEERNNSSGPLGGATVDFSSDGDVTLGASSAAASTSVSKTTSPDGTATTAYSCSPGGQGNIQADTSSSGGTATASVPVAKPPTGTWAVQSVDKPCPHNNNYKITISWEQYEEAGNPGVPKKFRLLKLKWTVPAGDNSQYIGFGYTSITFGGVTVNSALWAVAVGSGSLPDGVGMLDKSGKSIVPPYEPSELFWKKNFNSGASLEETKKLFLDFTEPTAGGAWRVTHEVLAK